MIRMNRIIRGIHTPRNRLLDSTMSSRPRTFLRSLLATGVLTLAGCVNPFLENYVGSRQSATGDPVRVVAKGNAPRLGTSRFSKKMEIGKLPGDDEARAAAAEVGAKAYWWRFTPSFSGGNESARMRAGNGQVGGVDPFGPALGEKTIKWYDFEAVFYTVEPKRDE